MIEYDMRFFFLKNRAENVVEKLALFSSGLFSEKSKLKECSGQYFALI